MNHQGLRWNVHCVANVALRIRLNLYKRGFKIYDLLVFFFFVVLSATRPRLPLGHTEVRRESRNLTCLLAKSCWDVTTRTMLWICKIYFLFVLLVFIRFEFEENNKYAKKGIKSAIEFSDIAAFTFATWETWQDRVYFAIQGYFGRSDCF